MTYQFNQPLEVLDFSGGFTDNYIDGPLNSGQVVENLLIQKNKKLLSRTGTLIYDSTAYQIPAGNQRIGKLIFHPQIELFVQSARALYYIQSAAYQTLTGPVDSNPAFSANATTNYISHSKWKNHEYMVSDSYADPIKVYKDSGGTWRVNTAGLPGLELEGAIDLANAIKTAYNVHIADITSKHAAADTAHTITASTAYDFDTLVTLVTELLTDYALHAADNNSGAGSYHQAAEAVAGADTLSSAVAPTTIAECLTRLDDLKTKYNIHDTDATTHTTGADHLVTASRLPTVTSAAGTKNYIYTFLYRHTYTVGDVTFEVLGETVDVSMLLSVVGTKSIANIPAISNGTTRCYDTATITCEIYRTETDGTVSYYVGRVTNGTTTFSDTVTDAILITNPTIYTNGGALDHNPPPRAKFIHIVNGMAIYAGVKIGTINQSSKYVVSIPNCPDHVPASFEGDLEVPITSVNSVGIYPIIQGRDRSYRLEGKYDEVGRGSVEAIEISRTKGCVSNNSVVQVPNGLVFAGIDQFYFTDGYKVTPIDTHHVESYKALISSTSYEPKISGRYDSKENRVYWCVADGTTVGDNNKIWVLDLNFGFGEQSVFSKLSNTDSWLPTDIEFYTDSSNVSTSVISDTRGYLFKLDSNTFTDPDINIATNPSTWPTNQVIYNYKSFATSFGTISNYKFVPNITLQAKNVGDVTIQINSINEDSGLAKALKQVRRRGGITWGDPNITWGDTTVEYLWNVNSLIREMRRFPAGSLRTIYKQIQITNAYAILYNSDILGVGAINDVAKTLTISGTFPTDSVNYFVSFEDDSYTNDFLVTARTATVLTYTDTSNLSTTAASSKWVIKGYKKGEQLNLLSYSLSYALVGENQTVYRGETGGNA